MKNVFKRLFGQMTKTVNVNTIKFNRGHKDFPFIDELENSNVDDHLSHQENVTKIDRIQKEKYNEAESRGIRDEKDGVDEKTGVEAFMAVALQGIDAIIKASEKTKSEVVKNCRDVLKKAREIDFNIHVEKLKTFNKVLLDKVIIPIENKIMLCDFKIDKYTERVKDSTISLKRMENKKEGDRPFVNTTKALVLVLLVLVGPELSITFFTSQKFIAEGNNLQLLLMTLGLGSSYAILSHALGTYIQRGDRKKVKLFAVLSALFLTFMLGFRFVSGADIVFSILYAVVFVLGAAFSYVREEHAPQFALEDSIAKDEKRLVAALSEKNNLESEKKAHEKACETANKEVEKNTQKARDFINEDAINISNKFDKRIDEYKEIRSQLQSDLEDAYTKGYIIAKQSNPSVTNLNGAIKNGAKALTLLLFLCLSLTSCKPPEMEANGVIVDVTIENVLENPQGEINAIKRMVNATNKGSGRAFYATQISDRSFGQIYSTEPLEVSKYWERNEVLRAAEINRYEQACDSIMQIAFESMDGEGRKSTHILRNVKRMCQRMDKDRATQKRLIIYSDLLCHNDKISLYDYRAKIDALGHERDRLANILNKDSPVDLSQYDLIVVHRPSLLNDEIVRAAWQFWEWYFKEHCNAKSVRFEQSLI